MLTRIWLTVFFLLLPLVATAQNDVPRVGVLIPEMGRSQSQLIKGLREELKLLGHEERKTVFLEIQDTKGNRAALEPAAAELIGRKVEVILTTGTRATRVAQSATAKIPIVFVHPADPVALGLVKAMEASGGNITGVAGLAQANADEQGSVS